jgi:hypothetical protein
MRALASALLLTAAGFGQGIGPLAVGMLNDALKNDFGAEAVRYSLVSAAATSTLGTLLFIWAARSIRGDIFSGRANSIGSPPPIPFVFIIVLIPAHVPATRLCCGSIDLYVTYITDLGEKQTKIRRMKPFCRNRETILKHTGRKSLANRGRQRCPGGIT